MLIALFAPLALAGVQDHIGDELMALADTIDPPCILMAQLARAEYGYSCPLRGPAAGLHGEQCVAYLDSACRFPELDCSSPSYAGYNYDWPSDGTDICDSGDPVYLGNDLTIETLTSDLSGLHCLCEVQGDLTVGPNNGLTDLVGLDNLRSVFSLSVERSPALVTLAGLDRLESVVTSLELNTLLTLERLDSLDALQSVGGDLKIYDAPQLNRLAGLGALESVGYELSIQGCDSLLGLNTLDTLDSLERLTISDNASLRTINGLGGALEGLLSIEITENNALVEIDGLDGVVEVSGTLDILDNPALESVTGLSAMTYRALASPLRTARC